MAVYNPPQPLWKRNLAGILDFIVATLVLGLMLGKLFGFDHTSVVTANGSAQGWGLGPLPSLILVVLVIAYFVILGRTGGTIFQRLFGMHRAK